MIDQQRRKDWQAINELIAWVQSYGISMFTFHIGKNGEGEFCVSLTVPEHNIDLDCGPWPTIEQSVRDAIAKLKKHFEIANQLSPDEKFFFDSIVNRIQRGERVIITSSPEGMEKISEKIRQIYKVYPQWIRGKEEDDFVIFLH
jgi:hypothetical protein